MRRSRRLGNSGHEFGSSGEDSFVAVVVTKLTGALLFILLLTMVIMALIPRVSEPAADRGPEAADVPVPLAIATPEALPEAIAGRPYQVALAATGGRGPLRWAVDGPLPGGLSLEPDSGLLLGTPEAGTAEPVELVLRVSDGSDRASRAARLLVFQPDRPLTVPSKYLPSLPPIPWRTWLEQGFGFLVLLLIHALGMSSLGALERRSAARTDASADPEDEARSARRRFLAYRVSLRLATLGAVAALACWLAAARP